MPFLIRIEPEKQSGSKAYRAEDTTDNTPSSGMANKSMPSKNLIALQYGKNESMKDTVKCIENNIEDIDK